MTMFRSYILRPFRRLLADESGATAIEYAMIAAGIGATIAAVVTTMGSSLKDKYQSVNDAYPN